ncbi:MAG: hypothetical protein MUE40_03755 [Anaerolineae bacterium]|nr:hypothetical protein [Anaerolineae bacterium]
MRMRWLHTGWMMAGLALLAMGWSLTLPRLDAQGFATNTPLPGQVPLTAAPAQPTVTLALNTPAPAELPVMVSTPDAPIENYPLRLWLEQDLIALLFQQIAALDEGGADARRALQLTAYELTARFPGAPTRPEQREDLIRAALRAPRGAADVRWLVQPYILDALNRQPGQPSLEVGGFRVDVTAARFNPDAVPDALLHILYPATAAEAEDVLYEEYLLAEGRPDGTLALLPAAYDSPVAPFGTIRSVSLQRLEDMNRDTLDEVVLVVDDGQANERWWLLGARGGAAIDLVLPGEEIRVGSLVAWAPPATADIPVLQTFRFRVESAAPGWPCISQLPVDWAYQANFYRPVIDPAAQYTFQETLGCRLLAAEPLFARSPEAAVTALEAAIVDFTVDAPGGDRALLTLAMFYVLQGRLDEARAIAAAVAPAGETDSWTARQSAALTEALGIASNTALDVCEALALASVAPVCDVDAVLGRFLGLATLSTSDDLVPQLEALGLPVVEAVTVTEIGRATRTVISFNLENTGWWGFAAQRDGTYLVEKADPPTGFAAAVLPAGLLEVPATAYDALLVNDDPEAALTILETLAQNNPDVPLSPAARFLQALSYDLAASRDRARQAYYALWTDFPRSLWGQLAARHLERR